MRDDSGHLKVADFGISELLKVTNRVKEDRPLIYEETSCESDSLDIMFYSLLLKIVPTCIRSIVWMLKLQYCILVILHTCGPQA